MNKTEKSQLVSELTEKIKGAKALYYTDFTGLNVKRMTELRRRLRRAGVEYVVIKNTLALRAVNESGLVGERLRGPTGIVVAVDPVAGAKVLTDFAKENDARPSVKGGMFDGRAIDSEQVKKLARAAARRARGQLPGPARDVRGLAQRTALHLRRRARRAQEPARRERCVNPRRRPAAPTAHGVRQA
jgi:large subunit ribosomal protein L10